MYVSISSASLFLIFIVASSKIDLDILFLFFRFALLALAGFFFLLTLALLFSSFLFLFLTLFCWLRRFFFLNSGLRWFLFLRSSFCCFHVCSFYTPAIFFRICIFLWFLNVLFPFLRIALVNVINCAIDVLNVDIWILLNRSTRRYDCIIDFHLWLLVLSSYWFTS